MQTHPANDDLKVYYSDDPDSTRAGLGLAHAPLIRSAINIANLDDWWMSPAEQMAMVYLLEQLRPDVSIEIGTRNGGSLQVIAKYSRRVFSLDIDPGIPKALAGKHDNVEYIVGDSKVELPNLIARLASEKEKLEFVLVDGDHSTEGVRSDIDNILNYKPMSPLYVLMHDSFNPDCRKGLRLARWGGGVLMFMQLN